MVHMRVRYCPYRAKIPGEHFCYQHLAPMELPKFYQQNRSPSDQMLVEFENEKRFFVP